MYPELIFHWKIEYSTRKRTGSQNFLSLFPRDETGTHSAAGDRYFDLVNRGAGWTVYFGHGHPAQLSDEKFLDASQSGRFENIDKPTIFFSMSCENGNFLNPLQQSMCKSFLFAPGGGAIAYIASPVIQYQSSSEGFAKAFFSNLTRHANTSIGNAMLLAKSSEGSSMARYFHLLGDPAIQPLRSGPSLLSERLSNDIKISCSESFSGHFSLELLSPDTVRLLDDTTKTLVFKKAVHADSGTFTDEFVMNIPVELAQKDLTARVFCWNDSQESRLSFDIQSSASVTGRYNTSSPELINIKTVGSNLVFSLPQVPKASIVRIYSLQGRLIYRGKGIPGARFVSIPLRRIGLSAGYYIATLENDNMHAYSKFGYHPH